MKKRINLLTHELLPPVLRLPLERVIQICVGLILLLSIIYAALWLKNWLDTQSVVQLKMSQQSLLLQKQAYEAQVKAHRADETLIRQVNSITQRITLKSQLLGELDRRGFTGSQGFSPLLKDLSQAAMKDLWLEQILVEQQHFSFEGQAMKPELVPQWIEQLKTSQTLKGYSFAAMTMQASDYQTTQFRLTSARDEAQLSLEVR